MKRASIVLIVLITAVLAAPGDAQESARVKYGGIDKSESVTIMDAKGVKTDASGFGKLFGPQHLNAHRGASQVQIPFERIRKMVTGRLEDNRLEVKLSLFSGREMEVLVDRPEYETQYAGSADFGYFRLRLQDIHQVEFHRTVKSGRGTGQKCSRGHIFYNDSWHFCPYDGEELKPIDPEK